MYSRYIPPAPKGNVIREPSPKPVVVEAALPQPTNVRPGSYSRYVPSAKAPTEPKKHLHYEEEDVVDALVSEQPPTKRAKVDLNADSTTETPDSAVKLSRKADKQSKKAKKDKKVPQSPPKDEEVPVADNTTAASDQPAESEDVVVDSESKKERKKKKEKKKKPQPDDGDVASEDDEIRKRHKAVLERKNKSMTAPKPITDDSDITMQDAPEPVEVHGLEPLPQPAPVPEDTSIPEFETLPPWLAEPIRVSRQAAAPFTDFGLTSDLGITSELATRLAQKGYSEAFAIQTAVIPQLLPHHCRTMQSDILVSAATGSGKTLAYAVPVIRDLSQSNRHMTRLRALVVLPTRELVRQAQKVCEECAGIFALDGMKRRIKVGTATGYQSIQEERKVLLEREDRYDADAYHAKEKRLASRSWGQREDDDEEDEELAEIQRREDEKETLPNYVVGYKSRVDILICTPGRLVDHIKYTPGFHLDHVRWLIADEADKLLGQGFQQWLDIVIPKLHDDSLRARHHKQSSLVGVRKIILSATMTRDLDLLEGLRLRRPKLVVLEGSGARVDYSLPELLQESALKADANLKPLFLLDLLQSTYIRKKTAAPIGDDTSSSDSDSSDSDSDTDSESDPDTDSDSDADAKPTKTPGRASSAQQALPSSTLIFTKSNQSALRLSRLLAILSPEIGEVTGLLTSETAYSTRKQTLQAFTNGKIRIIVASDLVARGIDFDHLENVINYDIPSSVASYVHRVGRTARAGRSGHAWTLFTDAEARWFWKEIAGGNTIQRSGKVERIRITEEKEAAFEVKKDRYEVALQALGDEVMEKRRGR